MVAKITIATTSVTLVIRYITDHLTGIVFMVLFKSMVLLRTFSVVVIGVVITIGMHPHVVHSSMFISLSLLLYR